MAMRGPLRHELTKYRKGKRHSLSGSVPGIPFNSFGRSKRPVSGLPHISEQPGYQHSSYMGGMPREYHPRLNSPGVDRNEYNSYESSQTGFGRTPPIRTEPSNNFNRNASELAGRLSIPTDDLSLDELWAMAMLKSPRPQENPIEMSADEFAFVNGEVRTNLNLRDDLKVRPLPGFSDITDALSQLEKVLPQDHPDIINLINAADKLTSGQFSAERQASQASEPLSVAEDSYAIDPFEEAEQFFNRQMQILEKSFDQPTVDSTEMENRFESQTIESKMMPSEILPDMGIPGIMPGHNNYERDPYEETGQAFDRQLQLVEEQFGGHEITPLEAQSQDMFENQDIQPEMMHGEIQPDDPFMEGQTLEEIIQQESPFETSGPEFMEQEMMLDEMLLGMGMLGAMPEPAEYDAGMVADEINQAIDQAIEPDPFQPQYDPFMAPQYMFDPQYMPGYMVQGPMPFGPDMGPGPMGPMPMHGP